MLLTAWRGKPSPTVEAALTILAEDDREFVTCENVKLELLPIPAFEKRRLELEFSQEHFNAAVATEP